MSLRRRESAGDQDVKGLVRAARDQFIAVSLDDMISEADRSQRAAALSAFIKANGGKESEDPGKVFSTPSSDPVREGRGSPTRKEEDRLRGKVSALEIELEGLKSRLGREDGVESASALGAAGDMAEALRAQTEVLKQAIGKRLPP